MPSSGLLEDIDNDNTKLTYKRLIRLYLLRSATFKQNASKLLPQGLGLNNLHVLFDH